MFGAKVVGSLLADKTPTIQSRYVAHSVSLLDFHCVFVKSFKMGGSEVVGDLLLHLFYVFLAVIFEAVLDLLYSLEVEVCLVEHELHHVQTVILAGIFLIKKSHCSFFALLSY